jgi:CBS domain containing-hemolysin-like protein
VITKITCLIFLVSILILVSHCNFCCAMKLAIVSVHTLRLTQQKKHSPSSVQNSSTERLHLDGFHRYLFGCNLSTTSILQHLFAEIFFPVVANGILYLDLWYALLFLTMDSYVVFSQKSFIVSNFFISCMH